jgi:GTP-binding protein HflX
MVGLPRALSGAGGVDLGEGRTDHEGRKAIILYRDGDPSELEALLLSMGITCVERIHQSGGVDPRWYFGKGRLQDVADELESTRAGHLWNDVDIVVLHCNATPRQLVAISEIITVEVWDRVRLLLNLFMNHANSVEARTQVRIARLQADRTVLRELASKRTSGERAGYGGGGAQALQDVLSTVNRELVALRKRQSRHVKAQTERRRQRVRTGAKILGLAGYTNAGKSSLFLALSGKEVLVEDKLFSTLETTLGRMRASPRVLITDTIGFIDEIPSQLLDAFRSTLSESLECDLLLIITDSSDPIDELERKLLTTRREVLDRGDSELEIMTVLSKSDIAHDLSQACELVTSVGLPEAVCISSHSGEGLEILEERILSELFGPPSIVIISETPPDGGRAVPALIADLHNIGQVLKIDEREIHIRCTDGDLAKLIAQRKGRIRLK